MSTEMKVVPWSNMGSSGLKVPQFILGFMQYGSKQWWNWVEEDEEKIFGILKKAYDHGIRAYDTADVYSNGYSEIILGKFLKKYNIKRDKVIIMTKCYYPTDVTYGPGFQLGALQTLPKEKAVDFENNKGLSRAHIIKSIKGSMERLGTHIDILQIHRFDHETPPEEFMKALNYVVEQGWTNYIGASSMKAVEFVELQCLAEKNGWHKFINMQGDYSLLNREDEDEMNYYCDKHGVGLTPYFALASGKLARPLQKDLSHMTVREAEVAGFVRPLSLADKDDPDLAADVAIVQRVEQLATKKGTKMSCVALAWLVAKGAHPIVGIGSESRLDDLIDAAYVSLTEEEIKYLEEPYKAKRRVHLP